LIDLGKWLEEEYGMPYESQEGEGFRNEPPDEA